MSSFLCILCTSSLLLQQRDYHVATKHKSELQCKIKLTAKQMQLNKLKLKKKKLKR